MRRWALLVGVAAAIATLAVTATPAGSSARVTGTPVFYLALHAGNCGVWPRRGKTVRIVACSNATHNLEVYWVGHGGWGRTSTTHAVKFADARARCLSSFQRLYHHAIQFGYGWYAFWPDPGAESAKYGDRTAVLARPLPGRARTGTRPPRLDLHEGLR